MDCLLYTSPACGVAVLFESCTVHHEKSPQTKRSGDSWWSIVHGTRTQHFLTSDRPVSYTHLHMGRPQPRVAVKALQHILVVLGLIFIGVVAPAGVGTVEVGHALGLSLIHI